MTLTSKPTEVIGMPGKIAYRMTTSMKAANKNLYRLEMNTGKGWSTFLEGTMTRK